ncbi:hypothetical protein BDK51DRAFT_41386 [Blyttiomyces helicus]|uniref:Uncharacterized protein n=1 Tax=Blyttiomyces helicus TaxID=388810 RepID=A0A4V1IRA7_9FUNG|nr:hypothetical protein BDK51DRAFT_41386 [Blyttiomyces helicus]|eukprot:RKO89397.1 hypothetical protein BDK51DRAFT_41386 [Blyttiomyces helicus]
MLLASNPGVFTYTKLMVTSNRSALSSDADPVDIDRRPRPRQGPAGTSLMVRGNRRKYGPLTPQVDGTSSPIPRCCKQPDPHNTLDRLEPPYSLPAGHQDPRMRREQLGPPIILASYTWGYPQARTATCADRAVACRLADQPSYERKCGCGRGAAVSQAVTASGYSCGRDLSLTSSLPHITPSPKSPSPRRGEVTANPTGAGASESGYRKPSYDSLLLRYLQRQEFLPPSPPPSTPTTPGGSSFPTFQSCGNRRVAVAQLGGAVDAGLALYNP